MPRTIMICLTCFVCLCHLSPPAAAQPVALEPIGRFDSGLGRGAAEIAAFHAGSARAYVVNAAESSVDIVDLTDPTAPALIRRLDVSALGAPNSVATADDVIAVALAAYAVDADGQVALYDTDGNLLGRAMVGVLPDMVASTPDGQLLVVANEGEPSDDYQTDPEGTISLIDLAAGADAATVTNLDFRAFDTGGPRAAELPADVRIFGPGASVAQDLEPEFVAIAPDGTTAWVSLQENNALAVVDLDLRRIESIVALGTKDHTLAMNALDASNRDDAIRIRTWPVHGLYQPDSIATFTAGGATYVISANEGDARDYDGFSEEARVGDLALDPTAFPNRATLKDDAELGRLKITTANGDDDGDGDFDRLFSYGARSFTIWRDDGTRVYDSGADFERITAATTPALFNGEGDADDFDNRSDDKGPEPESVVVGAVGDRPLAFIGLERIGGVMVYDVSAPETPVFLTYAPPTAEDRAPEGMVFVPAEVSPNGQPLLIVAYEDSGTVVVFRVDTSGASGASRTPR